VDGGGARCFTDPAQPLGRALFAEQDLLRKLGQLDLSAPFEQAKVPKRAECLPSAAALWGVAPMTEDGLGRNCMPPLLIPLVMLGRLALALSRARAVPLAA